MIDEERAVILESNRCRFTFDDITELRREAPHPSPESPERKR